MTSDLATAFARDGYADGGRVLDAAGCDELCTEVLRVIADRDRADRPQPLLCRSWGEGTGRTTWQIVNIWQASPAFARLLHHPGLAPMAAALLGVDGVRLWHDQIQYKIAEHGDTTDWHQDRPYWQILAGDQQVTAWIALDDAAVDNGCMWMVPGSHRWGDCIQSLHADREQRTSSGDFHHLPAEHQGHPIQQVVRPVPRGHVHWHHGLTWHGSPVNRSGRPRRAIAIHFIPLSERFRASREHPCKPLVESRDGEPIAGKAFPVLWQAAVAV
jgi:phytanoyl-CoA hydroxylase